MRHIIESVLLSKKKSNIPLEQEHAPDPNHYCFTWMEAICWDEQIDGFLEKNSLRFLGQQKLSWFPLTGANWFMPSYINLELGVIYMVFWTKVPILKTNPQLSYKFPTFTASLSTRLTSHLYNCRDLPAPKKIEVGCLVTVGSPTPFLLWRVDHVKKVESLSVRVGAWNAWQMVGHEVGQMHAAGGIWNFCWKTDGNTLQGINVSPPWEKENHLQKGLVSFQEGIHHNCAAKVQFLFFGVLFGDDGMD